MFAHGFCFEENEDGCREMDACKGHLTNTNTGNIAHVIDAYMHWSGTGYYLEVIDKLIVKYTVDITPEYQQTVAVSDHDSFDRGHRNIAVVNIMADTAGVLQHRSATYAVAVEPSEGMWLPNILVDVGYLIRPKVIF